MSVIIASSPMRFEDTVTRLLFFVMTGIIGLHFAFNISSTYRRAARLWWGKKFENKNNTWLGVKVEGALATSGRQRLRSEGSIALIRPSNPSRTPSMDDVVMVTDESSQFLTGIGQRAITGQILTGTSTQGGGGSGDVVESLARFGESVCRCVDCVIDNIHRFVVVLVFERLCKLIGDMAWKQCHDCRAECTDFSIERFCIRCHDYSFESIA